MVTDTVLVPSFMQGSKEVSYMKGKIVLRRIIRYVSFLLIFSALLSAVTMFFLPKWSYQEEVGQVSGLYKEDKNTIDVLGLGSCNMYSSFSPVIMYEKYGITGYNFCCPDQEQHTSYYFIKEALKTQKPKVVIIESLFFTLNNNGKREHYDRFAVDYLPPSMNKIKLASHVTNSEVPLMSKYDPSAADKLLTYAGYMFPILRYHGRTDLTREDLTFFFENDLYNYYKGGFPQYTYTTNDGNYYNKLFNSPSINETTKEFFPKIIELCKENDIQLVVMKSPNYARWGYDDKQTSIVREFVQSYGIPFVDFHTEELNTFEEYDYGYSTGRLNVYGMNKLSIEMGQWLVDNCGLTATELSEESKSKWDECVERYYAVAAEKNCNIYPGQMAELRNLSDAIRVRWNAVPDAQTYSVYRCEGKNGNWQLIADKATGVYYDDKDVKNAQGYSYHVVPNEGELQGVASNDMYYVFVDPIRNLNLYNDNGIIRFKWETSDGITRSRIQRRTDTAFNFEFWDTTKLTGYYNSVVKQGEMYYYRITPTIVEDDVAYFGASTIEKAVSQKDPCITGCSSSGGKAVINWTKISGATKINVWRRTDSETEFTKIADAAASATQYTDKNVNANTEYFYQITYNSANMGVITESSASNTVGIVVRQ